MENYHRHSCGSNIYTPDSAVSNEDYAKRAMELGHHVLSSVEHGWQGRYHQVYEMAKKYGLKFIFGAEAYWVKDRTSTDKTNGHIILLAKNETGRQEINEVLSTANETGYYYKPRVDLPLLMSLSPENVFVTSACVAFWHYEDVDDIVLQLHDHFKDNFMLEIQYHNTYKQKEVNRHIKALSTKHNIQLIVGLDSHYIYPEQAEERDELLASSGIHYDDEDGWYMDYPDDETVKQRFLEQGIFTEAEIQQAMDNTEVTLTFEDYHSQVFEKNRKLPTLYPDKTQEEKERIYSRLITKQFNTYIKDVPPEQRQIYFDGVKAEVNTYKETGMVDYPLIDYAVVKRGIKKGGVITSTGRGSAVGFFTNTLCGFSKVDRFKCPIKLYPERFMSKTRILETNSLPDIDMNVAAQEPFEEAQREILGEDHAYPMVAFGTLKKKAAFKMYARAKKLDFDTANKISNQIAKYDEAVKYADEDERDDIDIYDYVDAKYHDYVKKSQAYWGIIASKSKAPCAYLLYQGSIRREIGLMKCKSETTKREYITTVVDGAVAEEYKFLKNDWLIVDTVYLTDAVFKRIGITPLTVTELSAAVEQDRKVWDIYAKGLTIGVNQCEKPNAVKRLVRYKPKNVSELAAFIAAIRPGFKSMYKKFESREPFSYDIPVLDDLIQTEQFPYSFILYQESLMAVLNLAGFPMDECYGIIKAIAKKHPEKVRPLKTRFIDGFKEKVSGQCPQGKTEDEVAEEVWKIIDDSTSYSFNSAHAVCMAYDSLYNAWQKANYPYEFYEVLLQHFSNKGKKDKVTALKLEMKKGFGIDEGPIRWGVDNQQFKADKVNHQIIPSLLSIKGMSKTCARELYNLSQKYPCNTFIDVLVNVKEHTRVNAGQMGTLIKLDYFHQFGNPAQLLRQTEIFNKYHSAAQLRKEEMQEVISHNVMLTMCAKETDKLYKDVDGLAVVRYLAAQTQKTKTSICDLVAYEAELLGYIKTTYPQLPNSYCYVMNMIGQYSNKILKLYVLSNGYQYEVKVKGRTLDNNPIQEGDIIRVDEEKSEGRWSKNSSGEWVQSTTEFETILKRYGKIL